MESLVKSNLKSQLDKQAKKQSLKYFGKEKLPTDVFCKKYLLRDNDDMPLEFTPDDMHKRIAGELARIENGKFKEPLSFDTIYSYLKNFKKIIPQGSPMFGIGNPYQYVTISNCYVGHPPLDNYGGIHKTDQELTQISKRRGGFGLDISHIRPKDCLVRNSSKFATGILPFMERYSNSIREVGQQNRRGALMITIDIRHPESVILSDDKIEDIIVNPNMEHLGIPPIKTTTDVYNPKCLDFCSVKLDRTKITGANISIRFCDEFFQAVKNGTTFKQQWPIDSDNPSIVKEVDARKIWAKIVKCAWLSAEPGILFWDNILKESPADCYSRFGFKTISTNPCSEIPLSILDSCRLLLKNLLAYVKNAFLSNAYFDYEEFFDGAVISQRLMDDIVDLELEKIDAILTKIKSDPEPEEIKRDELELWESIKRACEDGRRTGTGLTGLADAMAALGIGYGTDKSIEFVDEVYKVFKFACYKSSIDMAKEVGPFKIWSHELEKNNPFFERIKQERVYWEHPETGKVLYIKGEDLYNDMAKHGRRNIALLTSAPAGSSSIVAWAGHELETHVVNKFYRNFYGTSSGIEPVWNVAMTRRRKVNSEEKSAKIDFKDANGDCWEEYYVYHPTVKYWMAQTKESDVTKSPWYGYTSDKINWTNRVVLQSTAQKHIDHAISSTINLPNDVSPELVGEIYEAAWQYGCKGMTVYRDGCRTGVLLDKTEIADKIQKTTAIKRPKSLPCDIYHITVNKQLFLVVVGLLDNEPYEVLAAKTDKIDKRVKTGHIIRVTRGVYKLIAENGEVIESVTELCEDAEEAITRLVSTSLRHGAEISFIVHQLEKTKGNLMSFSKCLARALKKYIKNGSHISGEECNICKGRLIREGGCKICTSCGNSSCS